MNTKWLLIIVLLISVNQLAGQGNYQWINKEDSVKIYNGGEKYEVKTFKQEFKAKKPKNIILMIGDGMGVSHVFAALTANGGHLFLENFKHVGFSKTQSADNFITDSAAGGTAISTGKKTFNGAIGVVVNSKGDTVAVKTVLELAEEKGLSTGLVATSSITHATPAAFVSHQSSRDNDEGIAGDILKSEIDVFIGGGYRFFSEREDGRDLIIDLKQKGYQVLQEMDEIAKVKSGKLAGLTVPESNLPFPDRKMDLPLSTETALNILDNNKKGLFLMVEGSQIDWGAHQNNTIYVVQEMLDFDRAIGKALEFVEKDGKTLIIVTADHETGGLAIHNGEMKSGILKGGYSTGGHTGVMVPVFAYGPGAEQFTGIMENTDIGKKIMSLIK
jgi:alkaline phosphatase